MKKKTDGENNVTKILYHNDDITENNYADIVPQVRNKVYVHNNLIVDFEDVFPVCLRRCN
jgi:hypothetical protein